MGVGTLVPMATAKQQSQVQNTKQKKDTKKINGVDSKKEEAETELSWFVNNKIWQKFETEEIKHQNVHRPREI